MRKKALGLPPKSARPKVELKPLPPGAFGKNDPVDADGLTTWQRELAERQATAIIAIAKKYQANPHELWKVAPLLLDYVLKDSRGRARKATPETLAAVEAAQQRGTPAYIAADLANVSLRTIQRERRRQ